MDDELTTGYYQQDGVTCHTSNASMQEIESFFSRQNYLKKPLATQISQSNACRLLSLGHIEGQSVQKYTQHNRTTRRCYTPRDSSRQRQHFGKSIPEFGETHSSALGCERRPVSASIMSRSCFASFPVVYINFQVIISIT